MAEDVSPDAPPPPVGSTNRSKPHSKLMATGQCHPRASTAPSASPNSIIKPPPHQRLASSPRVIKTSSTLSQPHTSTANYQETSLLPQSPRSARHGIQTLLDAEREASKIVQKAREFRTKRVREARDEAKQEIADYKAKKEDEFQKFGAEHSKGNEQAEAEASKEADKHIKTIKEAGSKGQASVVKNLLSAVFDVKPVAPAKQ
ncbi:hypothetical protein E4U50_001446 [Claviceps purpurea]|nr:hypothetical protein E4U50_001446 [Claviceps purpurea]